MRRDRKLSAGAGREHETPETSNGTPRGVPFCVRTAEPERSDQGTDSGAEASAACELLVSHPSTTKLPRSVGVHVAV